MGNAPSNDAGRAWARYRRLMRWMALLAAAAAAVALIYLKSRGPLPLPMAIATIIGVGLSVLLGTALMGLVFVSAETGHDAAAAEGRDGDRR